MDTELSNAIGKLRWAVGGQWSVPITPKECALILTELDRLQPKEGTVDVPYVPRSLPYYEGDAGDENDFTP